MVLLPDTPGRARREDLLPEYVTNHGADCLMWSGSPLLTEDQKSVGLPLSLRGFLLQRLVSIQLEWPVSMATAVSRGSCPLAVFVKNLLLSSILSPPSMATSVETF